jgi:enolase-phosphatase E1
LIEFAGRCLLLDIEGTTSSVSFVYDVLFPYARDRLSAFLDAHFDDMDVRAACEQIARDTGAASLDDWWPQTNAQSPQAAIECEVARLMDSDVKATGLKQLQGQVWRGGFESGALRSHVYADVPPALQRWTAAGRRVAVYSSGSIAAQKMFFAHTEHGNLMGYLSAHYDTTTGPKRERASYELIARDLKLPADEILFLSDIEAELDAAAESGMRTALLAREGDAPDSAHTVLRDFGPIQ